MTITDTRSPSRTITYREAMREAMSEAMRADDRVFLMGEDVGEYGGCYAVSKGMLDEFGYGRIIDTPLSESGFVGAGIGAALGGMRPIVEVMTVNFSLLAMDQIVNTAALMLHMSGGQFNVPIVIRMATGRGVNSRRSTPTRGRPGTRMCRGSRSSHRRRWRMRGGCSPPPSRIRIR